MNIATLAILSTILVGFLSASAAVIGALIVNGREKHDSAQASAEKLNEEWREFKEERIKILKEDNAELKLKLANAEARLDREKERADHLQMVIDEQRAEEQEKIRDRR